MKKEILPTIMHGGPLHKDKTPMNSTQSRIDKIVELYNTKLSSPIIFSSGGNYMGVTTKTGWEEMIRLIPHSEFNFIKHIKKILITQGIKSKDIIMVNKGLETVGEIYFLSEYVIKPKRYKKIRVVTNAFHMARCLEIYNKVFGNKIQIIPVRTYSKLDTNKKLNILVKKREKASLKIFREQFKEVKPGDSRAFEKTLYTKHNSYSQLPQSKKIHFY
jgi:uncharacterized SAM-binding protein YcdF (DUF218 family)